MAISTSLIEPRQREQTMMSTANTRCSSQFSPGDVPDEVCERWSLDFVTNLDSLAVAEFSELRDTRGSGSA
ncbi:hypothetical protein DB30_03238 [Enhygromyxa salina]|uniref:Uncharacterized protein n=1 Tax=Enhygromyxa salina TaxID=215803 RepID=A0A0C2DCT5_9BACT|nr:hypothetical protein [Enhygromyxa salina]KIG17537.1 hypothetical protein DB30_03238 [Enhygromyxa salina]